MRFRRTKLYRVVARHKGLTHHTGNMLFGAALECKRKLEEQYPQYRWEIELVT